MTLVEKLKAKRDFTLVEQAVADYILHHPEDISNMTINELADAAFVSTSAIVRLSRKVGLSGYRDLRLELVKELECRCNHLSGIDVNRPFTKLESCVTIIKSIAELDREAVDACYAAISPREVDHVAQAVMEASHA